MTRLSPYVTHGYVHVPEVVAQLGRRHILRLQDRIVAELGWREYFHHVWRHLGDGVFESRRPPIWMRLTPTRCPTTSCAARPACR